MTISLKRVYKPVASSDGERILVERLWPRGLTKEKAAIDHWWKEVAPSAALRKWYGHDPTKWPEFQKRYWQELEGHSSVLRSLLRTTEGQVMTLVYAARDQEHNSARVLLAFLQRGLGKRLIQTDTSIGD